jgi:hypothetical protein
MMVVLLVLVFEASFVFEFSALLQQFEVFEVADVEG